MQHDRSDVRGIGRAPVEKIDRIRGESRYVRAKLAIHHLISERIGRKGIAPTRGLGTTEAGGGGWVARGIPARVGSVCQNQIPLAPLKAEVSPGICIRDGL